MDEFYDKAGSVFVEAYDAFYSSADPQLGLIVAFYKRLARQLGGSVLEVACGTGRVALPLAQAGLSVVGVDRSEAMLACVASSPPSLQQFESALRSSIRT